MRRGDRRGSAACKAGRGRTFYAVGGTWRALARIHILQSGYPLRVMHGYSIPAAEALDFARRLRRLAAADMLADIEVVADARRPLLTYAALVLEYIIRVAQPKTIVFSTFGVREGLLHEMLPQQTERAQGRADLRRRRVEPAAVALGQARTRSWSPGPIGSHAW